MADNKKNKIPSLEERAGTYPGAGATPEECTAAGYFYCTIENACLTTTLEEAEDINNQCNEENGVNTDENCTLSEENPFPMYRYEDKFTGAPNREATDPHADWANADGDGTATSPGGRELNCSSVCALPIPHYEALKGKSEEQRLLDMRFAYQETLACYAVRLSPTCTEGMVDANIVIMQDVVRGIEASLTTINTALINIDDAIPVTSAELMTTFLGDYRDPLSPMTRRSTPMGTIVQELDTFTDNIDVATTADRSEFAVVTPDDLPDPNFDGIEYVPSTETATTDSEGFDREYIDFNKDYNKDTYSEEHETCLQDLPCTFEEREIEERDKPEIDEITTEEVDVEETPDLEIDVDVEISDEDITSGCANGDGLFDKLMTAIDSSIDLQFKNSRLDNKAFGEFYASAISSAMQQTTAFLVQEKQLLLDKAKLDVIIAEFNLKKDSSDLDNALKEEKSKYDIALTKAKTEQTMYASLLTQAQVVETEVKTDQMLFEIEERKVRTPLDLAKLTQDTKSSEKQVELLGKQIEGAEANVVATYNTIGETNATNEYKREEAKVLIDKTQKDIAETTMNGVLNRNLTEAKIEQTRVGIKTAKYDAMLKKYQAYATKVQTEEAKANGASSRRMTNADIQSKNKQASLYDQQRKTYIHGQRNDTMKLLKDMWTIQIDTLGAEGMVIEALKGPELSSKIERLSLDTGL